MGSRFNHDAETRYAPIEGEALAVAEALDKTRYFVLACSDLIIAVGHIALLKIFGDRSFEDISNSRLRNLKEKRVRVSSRTTVPFLEDTVSVSAVSSLNSLNARTVTWDMIRTTTSSDDNMQTLLNLIESGLPDTRNGLQKELNCSHLGTTCILLMGLSYTRTA